MRLYELAINDFRVRKVNFSDHFTSLPSSRCQSAVFPSIVSLYTQYRKILSYFFQTSGAFITFNLSETLEGRLLGEKRLLEKKYGTSFLLDNFSMLILNGFCGIPFSP